MFYTEAQVALKTKCSVCGKTFEDPRSLPCGECICNKCITNKVGSVYECLFCNMRHTIPDDGFPICKIMEYFVKEKPMGEFKCKAIDRLESELIELKDKMNTLSSKMHLSVESISEHCEVVRNQIEIKTESIMLKIESCKEKLLQDVDDYEMRCKEAVKTKNFGENFNKIIEENTNFLEKHNNFTKKQKINEDEAIKVNHTAFLQKNILNNEIKNLDAIIFDKKRILFEDFEESFVSSMIGTLVYKPIRLFDFNNYNTSVDLTKTIFISEFRNLMVLENGDFVITFLDADDSPSVAIFNKDSDLIKSSQLKKITDSRKFILYVENSYKDFIILNYNVYSSLYIAILNKKLNLLKSFNCGKQYSSICGNSENVIGLDVNTIDIYNSELQLLKSAGQINCSLPYFINDKNITQIEILNKNYILRTENRLRLINIETGIETTSIEVYNHQLIISYNKLYVVAYNENNDFEFRIYNSSGILEAKYSMINFTPNSLLLYNERIDCLFNKNTFISRKYC
jgi:hypothetical protein